MTVEIGSNDVITAVLFFVDAKLHTAGLIIATATDFTETYNTSVQADLQPAIDDGTIVKFDLFQILQEIVSKGYLNVTDACVTPNEPPSVCKKPDGYLFWDGIHPTRATHDYFAEKAMEALSSS